VTTDRLGLEQLLADAEAHPSTGWDFSWLEGRIRVEPPPWDYASIVDEMARRSPDLLDMGTGGGEWLSALPSRPRLTVATEGWPPNVGVATAHLRPLGVNVVQTESAPDNDQQSSGERRGRLPFRTGSLHLVTNRHESFLASEVARILVPGGHFVTQQLWSGQDFHGLLGIEPPPRPARPWGLDLAQEQFRAAGLTVVDSEEGVEVAWFKDVGAFVWYLKAIPWIVPGFTPSAYESPLVELHRRTVEEGPLPVRMPCFWLKGRRE
jgi:hypothetical protein